MSSNGDSSHQEKLKRIFAQTDIKRKPITGFVSGYHSLPFTLIGPNDLPPEQSRLGNKGSVKLTGKISVSPKLLFSWNPVDETYERVFQEAEPFMDQSIVGRVFSFGVADKKNLKIRNEHLSVEEMDDPDAVLLEKVLDDMARMESVNMGVIWCPEPRFYPVSLERFILSIVDREFQ